MKAGAVEFLVKPLSQELLLAAINNALARSNTLIGQAAALAALRDRYASLFGREREVMALVTSGKLNKQVIAPVSSFSLIVSVRHQKVHRKLSMCSLHRNRSLALVQTSNWVGCRLLTVRKIPSVGWQFRSRRSCNVHCQ
jgi:FixJ family two-component response regulator